MHIEGGGIAPNPNMHYSRKLEVTTMVVIHGFSARIRTLDRGIKTRCLYRLGYREIYWWSRWGLNPLSCIYEIRAFTTCATGPYFNYLPQWVPSCSRYTKRILTSRTVPSEVCAYPNLF